MAGREELTIVLRQPMVPSFTGPPGAAGDYRTFNRLLTDIAQATQYDHILHLRNRVQGANTITERESKALLQVLAAKWVALGEVNHAPEEVLKAHLMTMNYTPAQIENMPSAFSQRNVLTVTESVVMLTDGRQMPIRELNAHEIMVALAVLKTRR